MKNKYSNSESKNQNATHRFWLIWSIALGVVFFIHLLTLSISPTIWQDEVQILDYGRVILDPQTDWSINWDFELDRPVYTFFYLGAVIQAIVLKLTNFSLIGPRLVTLVGAMTAATVMLGWLLRMKVPPKIALAIGLIFLLDPLFVQGYRGNRIDCWVFALCGGACWALSVVKESVSRQQPISNRLVALAGGLSAIAFLVWPSAILLYPLLMVELVPLIVRGEPASNHIKIDMQVFTFLCLFTHYNWLLVTHP